MRGLDENVRLPAKVYIDRIGELEQLLTAAHAHIAQLEGGRDALLQACDTVEQIAESERDMALDTDDIRSLLNTATLDGQPVAEGEQHQCLPPMDPHPRELRSGTSWTCPQDGKKWISVKRMVNRTMCGEWRPYRLIR